MKSPILGQAEGAEVIEGLIMMAGALALSGPGAERDPRIAVLVYNYANISRETLSKAEQEGGRILGQAGVLAEWVDCPLYPGAEASYPACAPGPTRLVLRLLPDSMTAPLRLARSTFGLAIIPEDGGFGFAAIVCSDRAYELSQGRRSAHGVMLGHLLAHEIGHLLLGANSHSASGIMKVPWNKQELDYIRQGTILFTSWEAETIRAEVRKRQGVGGFAR